MYSDLDGIELIFFRVSGKMFWICTPMLGVGWEVAQLGPLTQMDQRIIPHHIILLVKLGLSLLQHWLGISQVVVRNKSFWVVQWDFKKRFITWFSWISSSLFPFGPVNLSLFQPMNSPSESFWFSPSPQGVGGIKKQRWVLRYPLGWNLSTVQALLKYF